MIISYLGHSFFELRLENGKTLVTDPYGDFYAYPKRRVAADICTVSHHHHDHDGLMCVTGAPVVIDTKGVHRLDDGVRVTGVPTKHDGQNGELRGDNLFFIIEAEGLRIGHAGDLGHMLTKEQLDEIGTLDVLMLPVGGYYTIDAPTALEVARALKPATVIPMHYRTSYNEDMPVATLDDFLRLVDKPPQPMPLIRLSKQDISERPWLTLLKIADA